MKKNKKGFSLIEALLISSVIIVLSSIALIIYDRVSINQKVKTLSDDMRYAHAEYIKTLDQYLISSFSFNKSYKRYDMSPAIQSNFQQIGKDGLGSKKYKSNIGNDIDIHANQLAGADYSTPHLLVYKINKKINKDICIRLAMNNIKNADSIWIADAYYYYPGEIKNTLVSGTPKKIATLKSISSACSNKKQDGIMFFYRSVLF